jgi:hypothetical protein
VLTYHPCGLKQTPARPAVLDLIGATDAASKSLDKLGELLKNKRLPHQDGDGDLADAADCRSVLDLVYAEVCDSADPVVTRYAQ